MKTKKNKTRTQIETHQQTNEHDWIDPDNDASDLSPKTMVACNSVAR